VKNLAGKGTRKTLQNVSFLTLLTEKCQLNFCQDFCAKKSKNRRFFTPSFLFHPSSLIPLPRKIYVSGRKTQGFTLQKTVFCTPKDGLLHPETYIFQK
jgi:hypothetical protein